MEDLIQEKLFRITENNEKVGFICRNSDVKFKTIVKAAVVAKKNGFHSFGHALGFAEQGIKMVQAEGRPRNEATLIALVGIWHDANHYGYAGVNDELRAFNITENILIEDDLEGVKLSYTEVIKKIRAGILATIIEERGKTTDSFLRIVQDADLAHMGLGWEYQVRASMGLIDEWNHDRKPPVTAEEFLHIEQEKFIKYLTTLPSTKNGIRLSDGAAKIFKNPFEYIDIIKTLPKEAIQYANTVKFEDVPFAEFKRQINAIAFPSSVQYTPPSPEDIDHDELYKSAFENHPMQRTATEIAREVMLATALEPLSDKPGCTTRYMNLNEDQRLEYYVSGGINIGNAFGQLAQRLIGHDKQPEVIYDLALKAQRECKKNRKGGRVNQGIIEMLMPIVASQIVYDKGYKATLDEILDGATTIMKNASTKDVIELKKMKRLAYDLSGYTDRNVPAYEGAKNVYEYYLADYQSSAKPTSMAYNGEFVHGFPLIKLMYETMVNSTKESFTEKVEEAYARAAEKAGPEVAGGALADCTATAIYLRISQDPKGKIIT